MEQLLDSVACLERLDFTGEELEKIEGVLKSEEKIGNKINKRFINEYLKYLMGKIKTNKEFDQVAILIEEARRRAFHKVNEELVLLYFKVGNIVAAKVAEGKWGDNRLDELAAYIVSKYPGLKRFNRRACIG